ncbi:bifunctional 3,4-dihydroxy-2-butanone-4-phosphate synthase/GTP cyclohydrolase II [Rhodococcus rhodochrous]|uniref:Riboflavin biosynthesis protein RibBA n=1 Tax=Rhodococcus rhodochrous TaxID=1829 RepID=A0AAW4XLR7_RHORH|nr:bifunctional 3,4-dihydroxy-2-butanone-4-phosphate synthase/GTP cyclohydrolase II [Rhodococcus rhodochrous]MCD2114110.1 bifunctional 3,4-dihydroxy-2-butanone-4-phosphate synthase/GTP cyclohydrolase II [Rhodococcus rhodochrous]
MDHTVKEAVETIRQGGIAVVVDDEDRENEGDLIMAAEAATTDHLAFFLEHTSGVICASMPQEDLARLDLPPMVATNQDRHSTAFTISVDLAEGTTTGISAADRALTLKALADSRTRPSDLARPGHVFPLRTRPHGVVERPGHTEAASDLARLAGLAPVGVLSEVVSPDRRRMANGTELRQLARRHGMPIVTIAELITYRLRTETLVERVSSARIPTQHGTFTCHAFRSMIDGRVHLAFVMDNSSAVRSEPVIVRVHSECFTGDVFGSTRCDCGSQLDESLRLVAETGDGVVIYLRGHEGRGIGIEHKLEAYALQDAGLDTVDANLALGLPVDARDYGAAAQILRELQMDRVRLITNNPHKRDRLSELGIDVVELVTLRAGATPDNLSYLETKRRRLGHMLGGLPDFAAEKTVGC